MPVLDWIGKRAVVNHHKDVPFHLLKEDPALCAGEPDGNLLIEGDNLEALKALLPYYAGKVNCIYIDPPYNTGNENWVYNDNVNSPQVRAWLGKVVGSENQDLSRHDKWLCMMYPRLRLLWELLSDEGVIFVSIDDNELYHLELLLEEVFGEQQRLANLIWKSRQHVDSRAKTRLSIDHEYILAYSKRPGVKVRGRERDTSKFSNPDGDPRGNWMSRSILGLATKQQRPNLYYSFADPVTGWVFAPPTNRGWRYSPETIEKKIAENRILFPTRPTGRPREKVFEQELQAEFMGFPSVIDDIFTDEGTQDIRRIFGDQIFDFSKPSQLVLELVRQVTNPGDLVLDSFAGSGTTGHAVLQLNKQDGGGRRFILVEIEPKIARAITAERIKRVISGYDWTTQNGSQRHEDGLGGGFRYCTLGDTIFGPDGSIRKSVTWDDLARHIWFSETHNPWTGDRIGTCLGEFNGTSYHLFYNGIGGNTFGPAQFRELPAADGPLVVYADLATVADDEMIERAITFKQIPYDIKVS